MEFAELVGTSQTITQLRNHVVKLTETNTPVLIIGESGTGKSMIARYLHRFQRGQLADIDCAVANNQGYNIQPHNVVDGLAQELTERYKQLEAAGGGTLFLRRIDALPLRIQKTLVQFCGQPIAKSPILNRCVRIICTSHTALAPMNQNGSFRDDLYYQLTVFPIVTPLLRDHPSDIPTLVHTHTQRMRATHQVTIRFDSDAMFAMCRYPWPGNVDELFKLVERKAIQYPDSTIGVRQIIEDLIAPHKSDITAEAEDSNRNTSSLEPTPQLPDEGFDLKEHLAVIERELIELALIETQYVVARAARRLRLGRSTLWEKLRRYELQDQGSHQSATNSETQSPKTLCHEQ